MFPDLVLLALRNVFRNRRRTILTVLSVVMGFSALACFGGFTQFLFEGLRETTIRTQLGHMQIYAKGYWDRRVSDFNSVLLPNPGEVEQRLRRLDGVLTVTHRLTVSGLASVGKGAVHARIIGVDPSHEEAFIDFETLLAGRQLDADDVEAGVIGEELRKGMGAKIGDWVTVLTTSLDGVINAVEFRIVGIAQTGSKEYDSVYVKLPIQLAQRALETDRVERILILLEDTDRLDELRPLILAELAESQHSFEIREWSWLASFYNKVVALYSGMFVVFVVIVGIVSMFAIANTMSMAVFERTREIGALRALGASRSSILALFLLEGVMIGLVGIAAGTVFSFLLASGVEEAGGITMPSPPGMTQGYQAYFKLTPEVLGKASVTSLGAAVLSSLYPAFTASRLRIVEALQKP